MPLPGIRAATSFLDELQRDLLETEDQDFDGFFDRWSALGVPEIEEYRGDRRRSRGEVIAEVGKTRRAIEKRPEILREAESGDAPILTGARRIARGADVLEGMMGNGGNGGATLIPISGAAPDATSFATPEFGPATAPENSLGRADLEPESGNTPRIDDGFAAGLSDAEDRAGNDATVDAGAGMSEDETLKKCESLQGQWTYWIQENVAQTREMDRLRKKIKDRDDQQEKLWAEILELLTGVVIETAGDVSRDGIDGKSSRKSTGKTLKKIAANIGRVIVKAGKKFAGGIVGSLDDLIAVRDKEAQINKIDEEITALEKKIGEIESDQVVTQELIAYAEVESERLECKFNLSLGIPG